MTINYEQIKQLAGSQLPVYRQYPRQSHPQGAFIELDEYGVIYADYNGEISNAVPVDVWNNRAIRWPIDCALSGDEILALVEDNLPLFERVYEGHSVEWDGSNHAGDLNDDASEAHDELLGILHGEPASVEVWDASEYLFSMDDLPVVWPAGQTLAECVERCDPPIDSNHVIDGDFEEALIDRAKYNLKYGHDDDLLPHHIEELAYRDEITREEADEWLRENS